MLVVVVVLKMTHKHPRKNINTHWVMLVGPYTNTEYTFLYQTNTSAHHYVMGNTLCGREVAQTNRKFWQCYTWQKNWGKKKPIQKTPQYGNISIQASKALGHLSLPRTIWQAKSDQRNGKLSVVTTAGCSQDLLSRPLCLAQQILKSLPGDREEHTWIPKTEQHMGEDFPATNYDIGCSVGWLVEREFCSCGILEEAAVELPCWLSRVCSQQGQCADLCLQAAAEWRHCVSCRVKAVVGCHRVLQYMTGWHRVSHNATGHHRMPQGITESHRAPCDAIGHHMVPQGTTGYHSAPQHATVHHSTPNDRGLLYTYGCSGVEQIQTQVLTVINITEVSWKTSRLRGVLKHNTDHSWPRSQCWPLLAKITSLTTPGQDHNADHSWPRSHHWPLLDKITTLTNPGQDPLRLYTCLVLTSTHGSGLRMKRNA